MNPEFAVILVDSTSQALRIEKLLNKQAMVCKLIPVPRHLSSDCGVCVRILGKDADNIEVLLNERGIDIQTLAYLD